MLETLIHGQLKVEKDGALDDGPLTYACKYGVENTPEKHALLTSQLRRLFNEDFPHLAHRMEFAALESLKNYLEKRNPANPGRLVVNIYATAESALLKITGTTAQPHDIGYRTPEERGFDPKHPENRDWKANGREGKFSWGTIMIVGATDLYARTVDGKTEYLGFNRTPVDELIAVGASLSQNRQGDGTSPP